MEVVFTSERLFFRKFTPDDHDLIYQLNSDPEVTKYVHEEETTIDRAKTILTENILPQYTLYNHGRWAVHLSTTKEFIGWCGLKYRSEIEKVDLGYRFMRKYWGLGYATEAAKRTLQYGFINLHLEEIFGAAHIENAASLQVLQKVGMKFLKNDIIDHCPVKTFNITIHDFNTSEMLRI